MRSENFTRSKLPKNILRKYKRKSLKYQPSCLIKDRSGLVFLLLTCKRKSAFFKVAFNMSILHSVLEQAFDTVEYCYLNCSMDVKQNRSNTLVGFLFIEMLQCNSAA